MEQALRHVAAAGEWWESGDLPADLVLQVWTGDLVHPRGVRIRGATIQGDLLIDWEEPQGPLFLDSCTVDGAFSFAHCRLRAVHLTACTLTSLSGRGARVEGDVIVRGCTLTGPVDLRLARVGGDLGLSESTLGDTRRALSADRMQVGGDFLMERCSANGRVSFRGAEVGGDADLAVTRIAARGGRAALDGTALRVGGDLDLESIWVSDTVVLAAAQVGGGVYLNRARVDGAGPIALDLRSATIGTDMRLDEAAVAGETSLSNTAVGGVPVSPAKDGAADGAARTSPVEASSSPAEPARRAADESSMPPSTHDEISGTRRRPWSQGLAPAAVLTVLTISGVIAAIVNTMGPSDVTVPSFEIPGRTFALIAAGIFAGALAAALVSAIRARQARRKTRSAYVQAVLEASERYSEPAAERFTARPVLPVPSSGDWRNYRGYLSLALEAGDGTRLAPGPSGDFEVPAGTGLNAVVALGSTPLEDSLPEQFSVDGGVDAAIVDFTIVTEVGEMEEFEVDLSVSPGGTVRRSVQELSAPDLGLHPICVEVLQGSRVVHVMRAGLRVVPVS